MKLRSSACALGLAAFVLSCASDFDTTRVTPKRGSLGQEMYTVVCDRVGANALREDVTGASYHAVCHADDSGNFADRVNVDLLVPLDPNAVDVDGKPVPLDLQQKHRAYRIARIEALARRRADLIKAFDAALPDEPLDVKDIENPDPTQQCNSLGPGKLQHELANVLGRMTDLENDRTVPLFTEALAAIMNKIKAAPDAQNALARFDARQGYRPNSIALGASRPVLSYPNIQGLVDAFLQLVATDSDPYNPAGKIDPNQPLSIDNRKPIPGKASGAFQDLLHAMREELRTTTDTKPLDPLTTTADPMVASHVLLSRPRSSLELTRMVLLDEEDAYDTKLGQSATRYVARRDMRGVAAVPLLQNGAVPPPFVDLTGANNKPDGLPDLDPLGRFLTQGGAPIASPFFSVDGVDGKRDPSGRAVGTQTPLLYSYIDAPRTFLGRVMQDIRPLVDPNPSKEAFMKLLAGAPIAFGERDTQPATTRTYAPDPEELDNWTLAHVGPPPPGLGTTPVTLKYRGYHADTSPIVDLVYALGQLMADPVTDDLLQLGKALAKNHPNELARLIGLGLTIKALADKHPEAHIPENSLLWDELLDTFGKIAHVQDNINGGGILEDLILAFKDPNTVKLQDTFAAYMQFRDPLTYNHGSTSGGLTNALNGPAWNLLSNDTSQLKTPVDRTQPDVGDNRSALQKFIQLLHDANGMDVCTKAGAVAHLNFPIIGQINYPTDFAAKAACATFGGGNIPPDPMPQCGILRIRNVTALLLDVALNRAQFDIRDPCLKAMLNNTALTSIVGGADAFLESQSGIKGFSTHPTVAGVGRLVYFETPEAPLGPGLGDQNPNTMQTYNFLKDIIDPVSTMVCPAAPFTDSDGTVLNLRKCTSWKDTIRGRDPGFLFPIEQFAFVANVQKLAAAFDDHKQPLLFVELFDTMHLHWGSTAQPKDICDPSLPRTDGRWCSQDGAVSYEPLFVDIFQNTDLFSALHDIVPVLEQTTIDHCDKQDPTTHACTAKSTKTGVQILSDAVRTLVDPARNTGLTDRRGNTFSLRNDGTKNPQVTKMDLFIDAMKGIDKLFADYASSHANDTKRQAMWHDARSQLVDTFFQVKGTGPTATWANPAIPAMLPMLVDAAEQQILAHCPDRTSGTCTWAQKDLPNNLADTVGGPTFAAAMDLLDTIRQDDRARTELEKLLTYLLDPTSPNDAQATTLAAAIDMLQVLSDDLNLAPLYRAIADAVSGDVVDDNGKTVKRGLANGAVETLSRIFAKAMTPQGETCGVEIDPNGAIAAALKHFVTPMGDGRDGQPAPIEVLIDVVADVNRADPSQTTKLQADDYANIANEISEFCLDKASGLEQVYEVVREATLK